MLDRNDEPIGGIKCAVGELRNGRQASEGGSNGERLQEFIKNDIDRRRWVKSGYQRANVTLSYRGGSGNGRPDCAIILIDSLSF